jgi:hypothetical protein
MAWRSLASFSPRGAPAACAEEGVEDETGHEGQSMKEGNGAFNGTYLFYQTLVSLCRT